MNDDDTHRWGNFYADQYQEVICLECDQIAVRTPVGMLLVVVFLKEYRHIYDTPGHVDIILPEDRIRDCGHYIAEKIMKA